jgi:tRNA pseudouridine38-40 synthase
MVRAITGTLLDVGRGKLDEEGLRTIIRAKNRRLAGVSVPGHALFLEEIEYPLSVFVE